MIKQHKETALQGTRVSSKEPLSPAAAAAAAKSLQLCPTPSNPWTAAYQAPPSMGFSRQEYWSGVPLPSPEVRILTNFLEEVTGRGHKGSEVLVRF